MAVEEDEIDGPSPFVAQSGRPDIFPGDPPVEIRTLVARGGLSAAFLERDLREQKLRGRVLDQSHSGCTAFIPGISGIRGISAPACAPVGHAVDPAQTCHAGPVPDSLKFYGGTEKFFIFHFPECFIIFDAEKIGQRFIFRPNRFCIGDFQRDVSVVAL